MSEKHLEDNKPGFLALSLLITVVKVSLNSTRYSLYQKLNTEPVVQILVVCDKFYSNKFI